jgi:hypothetical protein
MLADEIIALRGGFEDRLTGGGFKELGDQIKQAQRFDLSADVMRSARTIMQSPLDTQLRALNLCRLPFAETWFEWPGGFTGEAAERPWTEVPKRMGALVRCERSLQRGSIVWAWFNRKAGFNICPLALTFDWRAEPEPLKDITRRTDLDEATWRRLGEQFPRARSSSREALIEENRRFGVIMCPLTRGLMTTASIAGVSVNILRMAEKDIEGEGPLLRAAIMLMNSRNLSEAVPRPAAVKLNRSRVKSGKAPLLDYTHIQIRLTRALGMRAAMAADPRAPSRLHLVRGHFKVRRTGVFWWSPHPRGHAERGEVNQARHVAV